MTSPCRQDLVEEERSCRLRGHHLLDLLQQHALPGPGHHRLLLPSEELQPHRVSFQSDTFRGASGSSWRCVRHTAVFFLTFSPGTTFCPSVPPQDSSLCCPRAPNKAGGFRLLGGGLGGTSHLQEVHDQTSGGCFFSWFLFVTNKETPCSCSGLFLFMVTRPECLHRRHR